MTENEPLSKGEQRRAQIIGIARELLVTGGYEAFVMRDIAARADMKLGNLQYYFPTRDAALEAVIRTEAAEDLKVLADAVASERRPERQLRRFCATIIDRWRGDSGRVFSIMLFLAQENPAFTTMYREIYDAFYQALTRILADLDPDAGKSALRNRAMLITALVDGAPSQITRGGVKHFASLVAAQALQIAKG